jgi:L,D-transpeptidase YnhG
MNRPTYGLLLLALTGALLCPGIVSAARHTVKAETNAQTNSATDFRNAQKKPAIPGNKPSKSSAKTSKNKAAALTAATGSAALTGLGVTAKGSSPGTSMNPPLHEDGVAERKLHDVYRLMQAGKHREALVLAQDLTRLHPNFQLAQLVYADLLLSKTRPIGAPGAGSPLNEQSATTLANLKEEATQRLRGTRERPPPGTVPSQFLTLSSQSRHAIAIDAARSRLYLFENTAMGLKLLTDYYVSVGKAGTSKQAEGDQKTPLGVYFITSSLNRAGLKDFYGAGALPINYPNPLDVKRGKTGSGIWLHGTPSEQFARSPLASDGCVVLSNPDLNRLISTVSIRTTPVVIAQQLQWVAPQTLATDTRPFEAVLDRWKQAKSSGNTDNVMPFYAADFSSNGKGLDDWRATMTKEAAKLQGRRVMLQDVSLIRWKDTQDTMVVTFGEMPEGARTGRVRRQYWHRNGSDWKIFYEGIIG